jgi:NADH dehydrogenase
MTFVLVGAGPTGVELAASIAQLATVTLRKNFRKIDPAKSRILLLDGGARILPSFAESLSRKAAKRLTKLGVEISTGVKVEKVDEQGVIAAGARIPSATVLWTAGVSASPVVKMLGTTTERAGRASVGAFMDIPEAPNVFVVGDPATITQDGHPVPGVARAAIQQADLSGVSSRTVSGSVKMVDRSDATTKAIWRWSVRTSRSSRPAIGAAAAL